MHVRSRQHDRHCGNGATPPPLSPARGPPPPALGFDLEHALDLDQTPPSILPSPSSRRISSSTRTAAPESGAASHAPAWTPSAARSAPDRGTRTMTRRHRPVRPMAPESPRPWYSARSRSLTHLTAVNRSGQAPKMPIGFPIPPRITIILAPERYPPGDPGHAMATDSLLAERSRFSAWLRRSHCPNSACPWSGPSCPR